MEKNYFIYKKKKEKEVHRDERWGKRLANSSEKGFSLFNFWSGTDNKTKYDIVSRKTWK